MRFDADLTARRPEHGPNEQFLSCFLQDVIPIKEFHRVVVLLQDHLHDLDAGLENIRLWEVDKLCSVPLQPQNKLPGMLDVQTL